MKKYNPKIHNRQSIRMKGYDYSRAGLYFITICTKNRLHLFVEIKNGIMILNEYGNIAVDEWYKLPERFSNITTDIFIAMPNHIHGIIHPVGAPLAGALPDNRNKNNKQNDIQNDKQNDIKNDDKRAGASPAPTVGNIVGAYKSLVFNKCLAIYKLKNETMGKLWQRNYYEHIIRNEEEYNKISEYIINNPIRWEEDKYYA